MSKLKALPSLAPYTVVHLVSGTNSKVLLADFIYNMGDTYYGLNT